MFSTTCCVDLQNIFQSVCDFVACFHKHLLEKPLFVLNFHKHFLSWGKSGCLSSNLEKPSPDDASDDDQECDPAVEVVLEDVDLLGDLQDEI